MKKTYTCPHCNAVLNPNEKVVFVVDDGVRRGLMLLSAKPGDYRLIADPNFPLSKGAAAEFSCPVCTRSLISADNPNFVEIRLDQGGNDLSTIQFSRVFGEHATFVIDGRELVCYGEDAEDYEDINFFGSI